MVGGRGVVSGDYVREQNITESRKWGFSPRGNSPGFDVWPLSKLRV